MKIHSKYQGMAQELSHHPRRSHLAAVHGAPLLHGLGVAVHVVGVDENLEKHTMQLCIYIYVYVYTIFIYVCIYIIFIYVYIYICIHVYIHVYLYVCMIMYDYV